MRRRFALFLPLLLLACLPAWAQSGPPQGQILRHDIPSPALGRDLALKVYLPPGYDAAASRRYPVLYLLHGNGGNENDWSQSGALQRIVDDLIQRGAMPPAVIVMPGAGASWYVDRIEHMETAFIRDLLPGVVAAFRVRDDRAGRLLGGFSMGGYGALRLVLKYPDLFAAAALFSPAVYDPEPPAHSSSRKVPVFGAEGFDPAVWRQLNYPALLPGFVARGIQVPLFITSGDDDEFQIELQAAQLYARLRSAGQPAELRIVNGSHSWNAWERSLPEALTYIFQSAKRP